jgi:hypothetical protein
MTLRLGDTCAGAFALEWENPLCESEEVSLGDKVETVDNGWQRVNQSKTK